MTDRFPEPDLDPAWGRDSEEPGPTGTAGEPSEREAAREIIASRLKDGASWRNKDGTLWVDAPHWALSAAVDALRAAAAGAASASQNVQRIIRGLRDWADSPPKKHHAWMSGALREAADALEAPASPTVREVRAMAYEQAARWCDQSSGSADMIRRHAAAELAAEGELPDKAPDQRREPDDHRAE